MIFRQLFDPQSCSYSYLIARRRGGEALLIDPVLEQVPQYLDLLSQLDLKLVQAVDTHLHADHVTGLGTLRQETGCLTAMGEQTHCELVNLRLRDGDTIKVDGIALTALHTPGHTPDSHCLVMGDRVLTGDTLLIGATGRTDLPGGDPEAQYHSLFERLLRLEERTRVFPGHDYKGKRFSTIALEKACNPRLQVASAAEYIRIMQGLELAPPRMIAVAVPANLNLGLTEADGSLRGQAGAAL